VGGLLGVNLATSGTVQPGPICVDTVQIVSTVLLGHHLAIDYVLGEVASQLRQNIWLLLFTLIGTNNALDLVVHIQCNLKY
jgi:hypothetical protein